jgi:hypothetical protein
MTTITANDVLQSALRPLTQVTEIRTPGGELLGTYTPAPPEQEGDKCEAFYQYVAARVDHDELRRRLENKEVYTFEQVKGHVRSLESSQ